MAWYDKENIQLFNKYRDAIIILALSYYILVKDADIKKVRKDYDELRDATIQDYKQQSIVWYNLASSMRDNTKAVVIHDTVFVPYEYSRKQDNKNAEGK